MQQIGRLGLPHLDVPRNTRHLPPFAYASGNSAAEVQFVGDRILEVVGKRIDIVKRAIKLPLLGPDSSSIEVIRAMHEITLGEDLGTSSYIGGGTISEAFCRILYFDPLSEQFSSDNDAMKFEKGRSALWELLALHISHFRSLQDTYETCPRGSALDLDLQVYNRSLIMSEEGYIGLAPGMVETGDELCMFSSYRRELRGRFEVGRRTSRSDSTRLGTRESFLCGWT